MAELVERTGVAAATVRYYLASGLLPPPRRAKSNRFLYDERHVEVIRLIRLLQDRRSLSLETIGKMLPDLLPDLTGDGERNVFRPEMWGQLLAVHFPTKVSPSPTERLREAGVVAFAHHGYADVSIDDVCRATGIAKGSFYRHYSSKEAFFFATVSRIGELVSSALSKAQDPGTNDSASSGDRVEDIARELEPYLAIVFDLASFASQRRPGYTRALRNLVAQLAAALHEERDDSRDPIGRGELDDTRAVEEAIASALVKLTRGRAREVLAVHPDGSLAEVHQAG